jgi:hypothetical protein
LGENVENSFKLDVNPMLKMIINQAIGIDLGKPLQLLIPDVLAFAAKKGLTVESLCGMTEGIDAIVLQKAKTGTEGESDIHLRIVYESGDIDIHSMLEMEKNPELIASVIKK